MPDCKNPHSISYQILLWTLLCLCAYVLTTLIVFFCLYFCFFSSVCGNYGATPRTQDRLLTQISLRKGNISLFFHVVLIGFYTDNPQNFSVSVDTNAPSLCRSTVRSAFGIRNKVKSAIRILRWCH
jgi:hypothetical protein